MPRQPATWCDGTRHPAAPFIFPGLGNIACMEAGKDLAKRAINGANILPQESAKAVGLRYVSDQSPGLKRIKANDGFRYADAGGKPVKDFDTLARIKSLAIPPAWTEVWISPWDNGHLQATGRDAKGRKQHRYHPKWREVRDASKYGRMIAFCRALPRIRARVRKDTRRRGLSREKVLGAVVRLLESSLIRVGNPEYARQNGSFGLTTMRDRHARAGSRAVKFCFRGKSGKTHAVTVEHPRLARIVKSCQELPGQDLFQYLDEAGEPHPISSSDVNEYLRAISGQDFTAKDFRTWSGTVLAAMALQEFEKFDTQAQAKRNIVQAIERVAGRLGNTPTVCRKCYIHPEIIHAYLDAGALQLVKRQAEEQLARSLSRLSPEEAAVLALLQQRLSREQKSRRKRPVRRN